uniref:Uncharacterized protein n=1 Tax=Arundo donax TaxID=35708 RepID=A0A0A9BZ18_ARUDO
MMDDCTEAQRGIYREFMRETIGNHSTTLDTYTLNRYETTVGTCVYIC